MAPADPATATTAQSSITTSTTRPSGVTGFRSEEETVRSCAVVKKSAWPAVVTSEPCAECSKAYIATAASASMIAVAITISARRLSRRR